jgi:hypothetical protein
MIDPDFEGPIPISLTVVAFPDGIMHLCLTEVPDA